MQISHTHTRTHARTHSNIHVHTPSLIILGVLYSVDYCDIHACHSGEEKEVGRKRSWSSATGRMRLTRIREEAHQVYKDVQRKKETAVDKEDLNCFSPRGIRSTDA